MSLGYVAWGINMLKQKANIVILTNFQCITIDKVCNGVVDCGVTGSDEKNCGGGGTRTQGLGKESGKTPLRFKS